MSKSETDRNKLTDSEVIPTVERRRFTAGEKLRILEEADACTEAGQIGALVRREGIYSSYLSRWRKAREQGQLTALKGEKRGPKRTAGAELAEEVRKLRQENERLQARLTRAETIIEVQKKVSQLLGLSSEGKESTEQR